MSKEKSLKFKDKYFWHGNWKRKTIWTHFNNWEMMFEFFGFCKPGIEVATSSNDYVFYLTLRLGLFGICFGTSRMLFMKKDYIRDDRVTGFRFGDEAIFFSFYANESGMSDGWKGWSNLFMYVHILKGRETWIDSKPLIFKDYLVKSIPRAGYETEEIYLNLTCTNRRCTYSRWWDGESFMSWQIKTLPEAKHVLRVPGKGENSYDQDDSYGLDLYVGREDLNSAEEAAQYAMQHIDGLRKRRG